MAAASDSGWNKRAGPVFKYGLATGFALVLLGGLSLGLSLTNLFLEMLVVCAGLGVILGAFGSTASLKIPVQGATLAGVAAIAVALFMVLLAQLDDRYVRVKLGGDVENAAVEFVGDQNYLGAYRDTHRTHDFIVFGKEIKRKRLNVFITLADKSEYHFECISSNVLRPHLATGATVEWSFQMPVGDDGRPRIVDVESGSPIADDVGDCRVRDSVEFASASSEAPAISAPDVFTTARAQTANSADNKKIRKLINQLESDTSHVRRRARSSLASIGTAIVVPVLRRLSDRTISYRLQLGLIVALAEMMRDAKKDRKEIIAMISQDDLRRLVDASADRDRTLRIHASEFLFDLGDPRAIPLAFGRMQTASTNGRYNLLLIVKGAVPHVAQRSQRASIARQASALAAGDTPKTNKLIKSIEALAK